MIRGAGPCGPGSAQRHQRRMSFIAEIWQFLRVRKKLWLLPILVLSALVGGLVVLTQGTAVAPFIYTLF